MADVDSDPSEPCGEVEEAAYEILLPAQLLLLESCLGLWGRGVPCLGRYCPMNLLEMQGAIDLLQLCWVSVMLEAC